MKKLVVFGDSFANYSKGVEAGDIICSWTTELANKLNLPLLMYGIAGSSLSYSLHMFFEYYLSEEYDSEDYIIFLTSDPVSRSYTKTMPHPSLGVAPGALHNPFYTRHEKRWLKNNIKSLDWYQMSCANQGLNFELVQTFATLKVWADSHLTNKLLVMRVFGIYFDQHIESFNEIIKPNSNFFPILEKENSLYKLSIDEFASYEMFAQCIAGNDPRMNHFSKVNRDILVSLVYEIFKNNSINGFDSNHFIKNIYNTKDEVVRLSNTRGPL